MENNHTDTLISNDDLATELGSHLERGISNEAKTILEDAIARIKNIGKYISEIFKRGTTLIIEPTNELVINEENIRASLKNVIQREKDRDNKIEVWIDNDIWNWENLRNVTMPKIITRFNATIHRFTKTVTHRQIREEADKLSVKKDWNIAEAWNIIIAGIMAGEVDVKNTGIFAYFTIKVQGEDVLYRFIAYRRDDGRLDVFVRKVYLDYEWGAGHGACLSN